MDSKLLLIIVLVIVLLGLVLINKNQEKFWGGYFPVPYVGQPLTFYGRNGLDAATEVPRMIVNPDACAINPYYCERCKGYRCCCGV